MANNEKAPNRAENGAQSADWRVVVCQRWVESEAGWGTRPDGFSLHVGREALERFVREYWDRMPDTAPSEYSRPEGSPYAASVDEATYREVAESGIGIRRYDIAPADVVNALQVLQ